MTKTFFRIFVSFLLLYSYGCTNGKDISRENNLAASVDEEIKPVFLKDFILGPGDIIEILVWRNDDLKRNFTIGQRGIIFYPLIGKVKAGGKSVIQLNEEITARLSRYIKNPQISINTISHASAKIFVLGEVSRPGVFTVQNNVSVMEAVSLAGGLTEDAEGKNIVLIAGGLEKSELKTINFNELTKKGNFSQNSLMMPGDILYIPSTTISDIERFFVRLGNIIAPVINIERGVLLGDDIMDRVINNEDDKTNIILR